ncbi:MAG: hypothetical protein ACYCV7_01195 [Acidimicrobiales bacterium]
MIKPGQSKPVQHYGVDPPHVYPAPISRRAARTAPATPGAGMGAPGASKLPLFGTRFGLQCCDPALGGVQLADGVGHVAESEG